MKVLVTGASGFIGRRMVRRLISNGHSVRALVRDPERRAVLPDTAETAQGDVLDPGSLVRTCEGIDTVVHLVAAIRESGRLTFQRVNYEGTRNVLEAAEAAGVGRFVFASTIGATSDAALPYLSSRWMAEQDVARSTVQSVVLRFSAGFGEGDELFNVLAAQVRLSPLVPIAGDGKVRFQPIHAGDAARCLADTCQRDDLVGQTLELGGPEYYTYDEMIDLIAVTLGAKVAKLHLPPAAVSMAAAVMETFMPRPPVTREQLKMLRLDNTTALDSVESIFGFAPRPLRGNIDYVRNVRFRDALKINLGLMPTRIRDH